LEFAWNWIYTPNFYFFAAKIKVVKTFMASKLLFILENQSFKANSKEMPIRCGPGNPNPYPMKSNFSLTDLEANFKALAGYVYSYQCTQVQELHETASIEKPFIL